MLDFLFDSGVVSDAHNEARPSRKVIAKTRVLKQQNENILSCKGESDPNNLQGEAVSGSLTPDERKRAIDRRYRARVKVKNISIAPCIFSSLSVLILLIILQYCLYCTGKKPKVT